MIQLLRSLKGITAEARLVVRWRPSLFDRLRYGRSGWRAAVITLAVTADVLGRDAEVSSNRVDQSALPFGAGLAAAYLADVGLKASPDVIFADDFETGNLGAGWDETGNKKGKVLTLVSPGPDARFGKRCLRVEAHLGED